MTLDGRLEALVVTTELLTRDVETLRDTTETLRATVEIDATNIRALARIAEIHEHTLTGLEGTT